MEKKLNLAFISPLRDMAMRRAVINLWTESDMSAAVVETVAAIRANLHKVKKRIPNLVIPETLKKRMGGFVNHVQNELMLFKSFFIFFFNDVPPDVHILEQLFWTSEGLLDHRKTAEKLVRLQIIDLEKRFRLACWYCLEDYIPVLWKELPEDFRCRFDGEVHPLPENAAHLEYYWAFVMKGEEFKLKDILPREFTHASSTDQSFFKYSACVVGRAATEYFYQKLSDEERSSALCDTFGKSCDYLESKVLCVQPPGQRYYKSDVLYYLLSLMTHEQQMLVLRNQNYKCLHCNLICKRPALLLDILDVIWSFIPQNQYATLLKLVFVYITISDDTELFHKFYLRCPIDFKNRFVDLLGERTLLLRYFFLICGAETVRVVLENLDSIEKVKLFSRPYLLYVLLRAQKSVVELCVGQDSLSEEDRKKLKDIYEKVRRLHSGTINSSVPDNEIKFKQLFDVLDGTSVSIKNSEDKNLTKTKRTCSEVENDNSIKRTKIQ